MSDQSAAPQSSMAAPLLVYHTDRAGTIRTCSSPQPAAWTFDPTQLVGRPFADLARQLPGLDAARDHAIAGGTGAAALASAAGPLSCWHCAQRDPSGAISGVIGVVTAPAGAPAAGERERQLLRQVIDQIPDLIFVKDRDGRFVLNNLAHLQSLHAATQAEVVGKSNFDFPFMPQARCEQYAAVEERIMAERAPMIAQEELFERLRGDRGWFSVTKAPLIDERGAVVGLFGFCRDITDHKTAQTSLAEKEEQLRHAQRMEATGRLAGGVAHDFNNLLTAILGHSELIQRRLVDRKDLHNHIQAIQQAVDKAAAITSQLLAFSRRQMLNPVVFDLHHVVTEMEKLLRPVIPENIALRIQATARGGRIRADRGQVEQVIMNLVLNARDAMPSGGALVIQTGRVTIIAAAPEAATHLPPGNYVVLAVKDTGSGIPDHIKAHIFEPFFTTKGPGKGTGLGLATVYGIVQQSSGDIRVESEPGAGTTFTVFFPQVDEQPNLPESPTPLRVPILTNETILLVEDEPGVRASLAEILGIYGYQVLVASDCADALRIADDRSRLIDLLISDIVMPQMNGTVLAERLLALRPDLRVLFISGYPDQLATVSSSGKYRANFLQKPFRPKSLANKVREILDAEAR